MPVILSRFIELDLAVTRRCIRVRSGWTRRGGEYDYDGLRTGACRLGAVFRQRVLGSLLADVPAELPQAVLTGDFDAELEDSWHDAAAAEWWYHSGLGKVYED